MNIVYRNPPVRRLPPEQAARGENRELLHLLLIVGLVVGLALLAIDRLTFWLAPRLPFALETQLAETLHLDAMAGAMLGGRAGTAPQRQAIEAALQQRAERILGVLPVPAGLTLKLHYLEGDTVNAVATLGGHITVFQGLLQKLRYEEELDAVLAHEIGHVIHRHMIQHLSRGVMTAVALSLIGIRSASLNQWLIGDLQQLQQLAYSREAEREADEAAIMASQRLYGGTEGVVAVFDLFSKLQQSSAPAWTQSHPLPAARAVRARESVGPNDASRLLTPLAPPLMLAPH